MANNLASGIQEYLDDLRQKGIRGIWMNHIAKDYYYQHNIKIFTEEWS